jgi:hypothetical protein
MFGCGFTFRVISFAIIVAILAIGSLGLIVIAIAWRVSSRSNLSMLSQRRLRIGIVALAISVALNAAMLWLFYHSEMLPGRSFYVPRNDLAALISGAVSTLLLLLTTIFAFIGQGPGKWILRTVAPLLFLVGAFGCFGLLGSINDMTTPACNALPR